jgi:formylglycine-generating enzyme required for sulfatase activity
LGLIEVTPKAQIKGSCKVSPCITKVRSAGHNLRMTQPSTLIPVLVRRASASACPRVASQLAALLLALALPLAAYAGPATEALGLVLVDIPAGKFLMGGCLPAEGIPCLSTPPEIAPSAPETPQHWVQVPSFQISPTEVTLGQFKHYITATQREALRTEDFNRYNSHGDQAPVVYVSWHDAQDFIAWLNRLEGGGYRLPSEAEWEYACRAGQQQKHCGGDDINQVAWYNDNSGLHPHPVATRQANAWGLYDMSGNAWEWVQDCWHDTYAGAPADGSAWLNGCTSTTRGLRGGAWGAEGRRMRPIFRASYEPGSRFLNTGFRLARSR